VERKQKKAKYFGRTWNVSAIFPADFLNSYFWPFSYYQYPPKKKSKDKKEMPEIRREWNYKPKEIIDTEAKIAASIKHAFIISLGLYKPFAYEKLQENKVLYDVLMAEIYGLTYDLNVAEKNFAPVCNINKDFAESIAIKAKTLGVEPYSFLKDLSTEKPELYNPKRWDFNWFILSAGWDRERIEIEKANQRIKQMSKVRTR